MPARCETMKVFVVWEVFEDHDRLAAVHADLACRLAAKGADPGTCEYATTFHPPRNVFVMTGTGFPRVGEGFVPKLHQEDAA